MPLHPAPLHVVNGQSAAHSLQAAGIEGRYLPWDDVLHMGPIPEAVSGPQNTLEMAQVRAQFIASCGWASHDQALQRFVQRDQKLAQAESVVIWSSFELYDQLHLLQLLARHDPAQSIKVIHYAGYLGEGFSSQSKAQTLLDQASPVEPGMLEIASGLWQALCCSDPSLLSNMLRELASRSGNGLADGDRPGLPFMQAALTRLLQEYPWTDTGLARTEWQMLRCVASSGKSPIHPGNLFRSCQAMEEIRFMGDWAFWIWLDGMLQDDRSAPGARQGPLLESDPDYRGRFPPEQENLEAFQCLQLKLSDRARQVLDGVAQVDPLTRPRRWIGGVEIGSGRDWRWSPTTMGVVCRS